MRRCRLALLLISYSVIFVVTSAKITLFFNMLIEDASEAMNGGSGRQNSYIEPPAASHEELGKARRIDRCQ